jgi:hypothetical protein
LKQVPWIQWFGGLIVVAVACGTDRHGDGESETHWMDPCSRDADCGQGLSCQCGVCTLPCEDESDCNDLGPDSSCAAWESIPSCANAPTSSGLCVKAAGGAGGESSTAAGSGGDPSGGMASGGSPCRPDPGGVAGSSFVADLPPPAGEACPSELDGLDGLPCGAGQTCISIEQTCSCAGGRHNACVESACASPNDCPDGTVCTPSSYLFDADARCLTPTCTRDADCNADGPGRCALLLEPPLQAGETYLSGVVCVYPGAPSDPGSCDGALQAWPDGHTCPE